MKENFNKAIFGAIIGDIAGSFLEVKEINLKMKGERVSKEEREKSLNPSTPLFTQNCSLTDDSICTIALCDALLNKKDYEAKLKEYGKREINMGVDKYGRSRFGKCFCEWVNGNYQVNSWGNGCGMRISPLGYAFGTLNETLSECDKATICSHNNSDALKCARAVCGAIYLARNNKDKATIKAFCEKELGMPLNYDLNALRATYPFTSKAINSVPQAIYCFLVSRSFEETLRQTLALGGDVDTTAAISCSIASAYYGIPTKILNDAKQFIPKEYLKVLNNFCDKYLEKTQCK